MVVSNVLSLDDDEIVLDGDTSRIDLQLGEEFGDGERRRQFEGVAVERDFHGMARGATARSAA